jgi:hypothetical protein
MNNPDAFISELADSLQNLDKAERAPLCREFVDGLAHDSAMLKVFKKRLSTPFAAEDDIQLLASLIEHTDGTEEWLMGLGGFTLLHTQCDVDLKRPICCHMARRMNTLKAGYLEFFMNEVRDENVLLSLVDNVLKYLDRQPDGSS